MAGTAMTDAKETAERISTERVEKIAVSYFEMNSDNDTVDWDRQPGRVRTQTRKAVRQILAAIDIVDRAALRQPDTPASIPRGVGVKGLEWEERKTPLGLVWWSAPNPMGGLAIEAASEEAKAAAQADYERRILSALDLSPADTQCRMCGKTGLSTIEGDGGTECQLEDGRWTCSEPCWEKAGGYGPDLSPAEGETSDGSEQAAIEIADAFIAWMVRHDLLDADQEYRDDDIIAVLDELSPGLATTNDEAFASPLAAPSNPVVSDEMVERLAVAEKIIGQIEERFPNWRSYRDLIDCIDTTLGVQS